MKLLKNVKIYSPEYLGIKDLLIGGGKILKIENEINIKDIEMLDLNGNILIPGFIDQHVHITGGGGEGGFTTRVPEVKLSNLIESGITTVVGLLGTDSMTRSVENLVAKCNCLNEEGITSYCLTGSYEYPSPTLTGNVRKDIVFINPIIGAKIATNDHRDSAITENELSRLATDCRVAGLLSKKSGHLTIHLGDGDYYLNLIYDALKKSNIPIDVFRPTHVNRNEYLMNEAYKYLKLGGYIDLTSGMNMGEIPNIVEKLITDNYDLKKVSFSSDGYGSWSKYNNDGELDEIGISSLDTLFLIFRELAKNRFSIEKVLPMFTSNVSKALKLKYKGNLKQGFDADILILDEKFDLKGVIAKGEILMQDGEILKYGNFE